MEERKERKERKKSINNYFDFSEVFRYYFRKKDPSKKKNLNLKMMHGINRIAIVMFLIAFVIWIIKRVA